MINPFKQSGISQFCHLDQFIWWFLLANSGDPDQMLHFEASDQGRHCLHVSHIIDARLIPV